MVSSRDRHREPVPRRGRREVTIEAILDAAEELFAAEGPETVSVRDIAARAGVSHALVHRYLGKKTEIYDAVLTRDQSRVVRSSEGAEGLREGLTAMMEDVLGPRREYARLIAHSVLHGLEWESSAQGSPAVRRLIQLARDDAGQGRRPPAIGPRDERFVAAAVVAMTLGWIALEPWLTSAADLNDLDDPEITEALIDMAMRMLGDDVAEGE